MTRIRLLVIVGPTASGKTRLGVEVAHALQSGIVSADSRQVYRGLDIGSGKDLHEYASVTPPVPYHLIDVADPSEIYSVFHYQRDCYRLLEQLAGRTPFSGGWPLVMVGGTGLLVEAVLRGYRIPNVPEDVDLRNELMKRDHVDLKQELRELDRDIYERTDLSTRKRTVRAIEIARYGQGHTIHYSPSPPVAIDATVFAVTTPRDELHRRIDDRLDARLAQGMIEEVQGLLDAGLSPARLNQLGLEYREVSAFLRGDKTRAQMVEDLRGEIRRFAKRQLTWFRGFPRRGIEVQWVEREHRRLILNSIPGETRPGEAG